MGGSASSAPQHQQIPSWAQPQQQQGQGSSRQFSMPTASSAPTPSWLSAAPQQPPQAQPQLPQLNPLPTVNPLSLGTMPPIPPKFITAIQKGEWVNFQHLYSALVHAGLTKPGFSITLDDNSQTSTPSLSVVSKSVEERKEKIRNLAAWLHTWNTYMEVFLIFRPDMVSQLLAYQQYITLLARTYFVDNWLAYDSGFRLKRANNPSLRWDVEDNQLYITYLRTAPVLASSSLPVTSSDTSNSRSSSSSQSSSLSHITCFNCGKFGHKIADCRYALRNQQSLSGASGTQPNYMASGPTYPDYTQTHQAFPAPQRSPMRNQQRAGDSSGFCFDWNNGVPCQPGCRRDHRCSHCKELGHPRCRCKKYPPNQHNQQQQHHYQGQQGP